MYNNRLVPFTQLMKCHTQYFDPFLRIHTFILRGDGPLAFSERHYIAIMVCILLFCAR
ncbi:sestrin-like protein [Leptotrombidium deliense]|uniref:Sestrin-like protein n=1 Tax=Leptotrombidium deliense TaxID=299467 RepID=A0A443SRQ6_9ACAR|nr:sestrin-like protein [Leptotrombidium deliense]